jgi:ketosteroid isomerase-like protein
MPGDNVRVVERFFAARNAGDLDAMVDCFHPDAEFDLTESRAPYQGLYRGHEEIRRVWEEALEPWSRIEMHAEDPVELGGQVVVTVRVTGRGDASGIELAGQGANLLTVRDGLISGFKLFQTRAEAEEAAEA